MNTATLSSAVEHEFTKPCEARFNGCSGTAAWAAWVGHDYHHVTATRFVCEGCKNQAENWWAEAVGDACPCGHHYVGQVSDNFRVIEL